MATNFSSSMVNNFRKTFTHVSKDVTHYFPNHMAKGLQQMQKTVANVDCIVEVHDARIVITDICKFKYAEKEGGQAAEVTDVTVPLSGRNPKFGDTLMVRPHMLVLNKMDLACTHHLSRIEQILREEHGIKKVLMTSCKDNIDETVKFKLMPAVMELINGADRYNRSREESFNILIIGIPNVGKSSLINALRRIHLHKSGKATPVGAMAGVTRSVMEKIKVCEKPKVYVFDSPGIMPPNVTDMDVGMKLALCASLRDHQVGITLIADYMLFSLNRFKHFEYVERYGLDGPTDDIMYLLTCIAKKNNLVQKLRSPSGGYVLRPNFARAAQMALKDFRGASLGKINLDLDLLEQDNRGQQRLQNRTDC